MKIGFIGLGIMGKPMSKNLMKAGHELVVFDLNQDAVAEVVAAGATAAESSKAVAEQCSLIITMLPNSPHVEAVVCGKDGVLEGAKPGTDIIDMSSIAPLASKAIAEKCAAAGVNMMDAPVSGGEPKAIDGTLSIMCGGPKVLFDKYEDILLVMGASAVHCGDVNGAGNTVKLANQIIVAVNIAACAEAYSLSTMAGVNPEKVFAAIRGGLAGSQVLDAKAPMMLARNVTPGGKISINLKDIKNVMLSAHAMDVPLPMTAQLLEIMQSLKVNGHMDEDHSAIIRYFEALAGVEVRAGGNGGN